MSEIETTTGNTGELLERQLYEKNTLPHPPYNSKDGKFHSNQFDAYIKNHTAKNYLGGIVIFGDGDLAKATTLVENQHFHPYQFPALTEVERFITVPQQMAVCIAEMRNGVGDVFDGVSFALMMAKSGIDTTLVLPRDALSYDKTRSILNSLQEEINHIHLKTADYHQAFDEVTSFDLVVYPSTQRYVGVIPAKTSILLRESGESSFRSGLSWRADSWGGTTVYFNTGYDENVDRYGAGPIGKLFSYENCSLTPNEECIVGQIQRMKEASGEVTVAYSGSNEETEASNFLREYRNILQSDWHQEQREITALVPGDILSDPSAFDGDIIHFHKLGKVRNIFLSHILTKYISREIPSLVAGSMSLVEAMYYGIPLFYKAELWKEGNVKALSKLISKSGMTPCMVEGARSAGILKGLDVEGSPVNILYFGQPENPKKLANYSTTLQQTANHAIERLPKSIIGWYGFLKKLHDEGNPQHFKEELQRQKGNTLLLSPLI
ncbi:hypothetical protein A3D77_00280 [Candidatus Gottesmanbacteria bacterium RIFCSPHIGHO2_02_FULL_39_11]|uniref:Uncharacterized protein n=1 Tax=Candidatus Gottesmanbacteria bacterium RIFCSPHIGHO2_02_FULL_39_11 TaxID=1798382 RepID=A0A1F5ZWJ0_9BACT|nr:MAG: hypothetical protein A3D77_00280 [Candidatus Gottesmanbacteria bacterium RIFCSPHIGHO2_02_FULL_39_11]